MLLIVRLPASEITRRPSSGIGDRIYSVIGDQTERTKPVDELWDSFREEVGAELFAVAELNSEIDCRMTPLTGRPDATQTPITPDVRFFLQPRRMHRFHHSFHSRFALAPSHPARLRSCLLVQRPR